MRTTAPFIASTRTRPGTSLNAPHVQSFPEQSERVYEEEVREEFRTWPSQPYAAEPASEAMDSLEREVADLRSEVREISRKVDLSLSTARQQQSSSMKSEEIEKMERLKKELQELKALLEQLRKEK